MACTQGTSQLHLEMCHLNTPPQGQLVPRNFRSEPLDVYHTLPIDTDFKFTEELYISDTQTKNHKKIDEKSGKFLDELLPNYVSI